MVNRKKRLEKAIASIEKVVEEHEKRRKLAQELGQVGQTAGSTMEAFRQAAQRISRIPA